MPKRGASLGTPAPPSSHIYIHIYIHTCVYEHITIYTDDHMPCIARESGFLLGMCAMRATSTRGFLVNVPFANRENARLPCQHAFCKPRKRGPALSTCLLQPAKTRACLVNVPVASRENAGLP